MLDTSLAVDRINYIQAKLDILKDIIRESNKPVSFDLSNEEVAKVLIKALDSQLTQEQKVAAVAIQLRNFYGVRGKPL